MTEQELHRPWNNICFEGFYICEAWTLRQVLGPSNDLELWLF